MLLFIQSNININIITENIRKFLTNSTIFTKNTSILKQYFCKKLTVIQILQVKKIIIIIINMILQSNRKNTRSTQKLTVYSRIIETSLNRNKENIKKQTKKPSAVYKDFHDHPARKYIGDTRLDHNTFQQFSVLLYRGLYYSVHHLRGPSQQFLQKNSIILPEPEKNFDKILLLDLDETLIHTILSDGKADVVLNQEIKFNIRPNCLQFLEKMNKHFGVYVFTASTQDYAQLVIDYLNKNTKTITSVLHRKNCMKTHNGLYIKDLRIIKNRPLSKIMIVDNWVHSFGLQLQNGIPILTFTNNKQDKELHRLQKFLLSIKDVEDVRDHIKTRINLRSCLNFQEAQFLFIDNPKN